MRRLEIIEGVNRLLDLIEEANLIDAVTKLRLSLRDEKIDLPVAEILHSIQSISRFKPLISPVIEQTIAILDLEIVFADEFWRQAIARPKDQSELLRAATEARHSLAFVVNYLPRLLDLIETRATTAALENAKKAVSGGNKVLSIVLPEGEDELSTPARIKTAMSAIEDLYDVAMVLGSDSFDPILVLGLDSGSDKSIDFVGSAKPIATVRDALVQILNVTIFLKESRAERRVEILEKEIGLFARIAEFESSGKAREGELAVARQKTIRAVEALLEAGAVLAEQDRPRVVNPRKYLATTQVKMLPSPEQGGPATAKQPAVRRKAPGERPAEDEH
ncbi:hypothetical protein [Roseiterribacter gracilis]|uniref:Uncharacterized protein n=1 Tax=Roseiterribacter gracilis TaxID=2812848 RepID=A0A8S8XE41_9PROT|nr:hypothetical protein TMPK1_23680 [Rhodospirillales bacterium TMPK1]